MQNVLDEQLEIVRRKVGPDAHVICALSGGVDSAVAATLVHKAIGDRLHCCFVDNGLLRYKEQERVMDDVQVRSIQKFFTHRPVSTFDRVSFQLTDEYFLYGTTLRDHLHLAGDVHRRLANGFWGSSRA